MKIKYLIIALILESSGLIAQDLRAKFALRFGSSSDETIQHSLVDKDGNIYITGYYTGTVDFDPGNGVSNLSSKGLTDMFLTKLNNDGDFVWARSIGGTQEDGPYKMAFDGNENIYITGIFEGNVDFDPNAGTKFISSFGLYDVFVMKMDKNGNLIWAKTIGSNNYEYVRDIAVNKLGEVITTGYFTGNVDFDPSIATYNLSSMVYDTYIQILDSSGNFESAFCLKGRSDNYSRSITTDATNNIYLTGRYLDTLDCDPSANVFEVISNGSFDMYMIKLSPTGNFIWAKSFGSSLYDESLTIKILNNEILISGWVLGQCDFDPNAGVTNYNPVGSTDFFISKFNLDGNLIWGKGFGGLSSDVSNDFTIDSYNNIYTIGEFVGSILFKPGVDSISIRSNGNRDVFFFKMDQNGKVIWATSFGRTAIDVARSINVNSIDEVYICGMFMSSIKFDMVSGPKTLLSSGMSDAFIVKFPSNTSGLTDVINNNLNIYPNPSNGSLTLENSQTNIASIEIRNLEGKLLYTLEVNDSYIDLNLENLSSSVYMITVTLQSGIVVNSKWVKMD